MSDRDTELVIQISPPTPASLEAHEKARKAEDSRLTMELRQYLRPGLEVALILDGCRVITSIRWLSELEWDRSFRIGVRLFAVSALPDRGCRDLGGGE